MLATNRRFDPPKCTIVKTLMSIFILPCPYFYLQSYTNDVFKLVVRMYWFLFFRDLGLHTLQQFFTPCGYDWRTQTVTNMWLAVGTSMMTLLCAIRCTLIIRTPTIIESFDSKRKGERFVIWTGLIGMAGLFVYILTLINPPRSQERQYWETLVMKFQSEHRDSITCYQVRFLIQVLFFVFLTVSQFISLVAYLDENNDVINRTGWSYTGWKGPDQSPPETFQALLNRHLSVAADESAPTDTSGTTEDTPLTTVRGVPSSTRMVVLPEEGGGISRVVADSQQLPKQPEPLSDRENNRGDGKVDAESIRTQASSSCSAAGHQGPHGKYDFCEGELRLIKFIETLRQTVTTDAVCWKALVRMSMEQTMHTSAARPSLIEILDACRRSTTNQGAADASWAIPLVLELRMPDAPSLDALPGQPSACSSSTADERVENTGRNVPAVSDPIPVCTEDDVDKETFVSRRQSCENETIAMSNVPSDSSRTKSDDEYEELKNTILESKNKRGTNESDDDCEDPTNTIPKKENRKGKKGKPTNVDRKFMKAIHTQTLRS